MKKVICEVGIFSLGQTVYIVNEDEIYETITVQNLFGLGKAIVEACSKAETKHIHLYGNSEFVNEVIEDIYLYNATQYNNNEEFMIEVN